MTYDEIIDFTYDTKPRQIFEMDKNTLNILKPMRDGEGTYFWKPEPNYPNMPGTFLGIPISIAKDKCLQIKYLFADGHEHVIKFENGFEKNKKLFREKICAEFGIPYSYCSRKR